MVRRVADPDGETGEKVRAFGELVERFQDMAYGYAYSILGDFHLAEDAAQEAFVAAYRQLDKLRAPESFAGWLRRIVRTACHRLTRRRREATAPLERAGFVPTEEMGPDETVERMELRDRVLAAVRSLPEAQRTVTTLFYIDGYSHEEIGEFLDVPATTVNSRLHASRQKLKERMFAMVADELKSHALPAEFPEQIGGLLALPRPLLVPDHPVRRTWEAFRSYFPEFELVELDEICERSLTTVPPDRQAGYIHAVDDRRILRHNLTSELVDLWLRRGGGPCHLITAGRVFRKGTPDDPRKSAGVHHQAEILWVAEGLDDARCVATARRTAAAVLGNVEVDVSSLHADGSSLRARGFASRWRGESLKFGAGGMHPDDAVRRAGLDPGACGAISLAFGLERCAQIRHDLSDIRELWQPPYVPG